jgi:hypothetical protein
VRAIEQPIAVAPAAHETAASYVTRLAALHGMPFAELWPQLYHRHVTAVLVRDWSVPMAMFAGTVDASANTWKFRNEATRPSITAGPSLSSPRESICGPTQPVGLPRHGHHARPWPTRTGPKVSAGRLLLGKERTGVGPPIRR